jgi:hypothetical protein
MAGNTKFIGFSPDGMVQLERWGGKAMIEISKESLNALRAACYNGLPKNPPAQLHSTGTHVEYDEERGRVEILLDPEKALQLANAIEGWDLNLASDLKFAYEAHLNFHDTSKEPGVNERTH